MTNLDSIVKSRDATLSKKVHLVKAMVFPVVMYGCELDCEEGWVPKNWCFWTVVLEKTLESPLDCKEIQSVHPKGDQSWEFIGRTDAEAEMPILWPPHGKSWLIGKDPDAERNWGQEEKGTTEDEMAGWHHWLHGHEFEYSGSWWWTGRPGVMQIMGSQRVGHDWATELNWKWLSMHRGAGFPEASHYVQLQEQRASLVAQKIKNVPAVWETPVLSLGGEDPLEKEMATHSSILAWRIPWTKEPGRL